MLEAVSEKAGTPVLSYSRGADVPLLQLTISELLAENARRYPDRDALVVRHQNVRLTWRELDAEATRTARGLAGLGLRPGDRAGIWAANCLEWVLLLVRRGARRRGAGDGQPGLPLPRTALRAEALAHPRAVPGGARRPRRLPRHPGRIAQRRRAAAGARRVDRRPNPGGR